MTAIGIGVGVWLVCHEFAEWNLPGFEDWVVIAGTFVDTHYEKQA